MKATDQLLRGPAVNDPAGSPAVHRLARSGEVLTQHGEGRAAYLVLNPYSGCEFGCVYCRARQLPPFRDADPRLFEREVHARANASDELLRALRDGRLARHPLVLGTHCDPWQPAEKRFEVTRRALETLVRHGAKVELRAQTRSTLVTRDRDLLLALGRTGKVSLAFSIATLDRRISRLFEPQAPAPELRFAAMEALAGSGIRVGVLVAPVIAGLNDALPGLEALLRKARSFGASFAGAAPLSMGEEARARMVRFYAREDPERATRLDRLLARSADQEVGFSEQLSRGFDAACERVGLDNVWGPRFASRDAEEGEPHGPRQLSLF